DLEITYYADQEDAEGEENPIEDPAHYTNIENPQIIYVRLTDPETGCYGIASFSIEVYRADLAGGDLELTDCSPYDLTALGGQLPAGVEAGYYESESDARQGENPIADPSAYVSEGEEHTLYVRLTGAEGCVDLAELRLVRADCIIPEGISPNGDGVNDNFDLRFLTAQNPGEIQIFNRYGTRVYQKTGYGDQWFGQDDNGTALPTGTYYYVLRLAHEDPNFGRLIKGWVYVQRER